jgi:hypothetical protein
VASPGAQAVQPLFDAFHLPEGARLFAYTPSNNYVAGAFTARNHTRSGAFAIAPLPGDALVLELHLPAGVPQQGLQLHVYSLIHCYRDWASGQRKGFDEIGASGNCNVNAACAEGDNWQAQRDAVVGIGLILPVFGASLCTGTLVNNTAQNFAPYVLTALHCGLHPFNSTLAPQNLLDQWTFYFDFRSPGCTYSGNQNDIPNQTLTGCTVIEHSDDDGGENGSDFLLLELNEEIPENFTPYWAGWNAEDIPATNGVGIHHPLGDLMKISTYTSPLQHEQWGTLDSSHWKVQWVATANGYGITEGGSSGSALFDQNGRLVGTLTGGNSGCGTSDKTDEYGKMSYHWNRNGVGNHLRPWLDPTNSGVLTLDGTYRSNGLPANGLQTASTISVYPNPTQGGTLQLSVPGVAQAGHFTLTDAAGRLVLRGAVAPDGTVNIGQPAPGLYSLGVTSSAGRVFATRVWVR